MSESDFGLIGLAVMGQNLVLNVESRGFQVSVYNRTTSVTEKFIAVECRAEISSAPRRSRTSSAASKRPRKIQIMVKAGAPVDAVIEQLVPLLEQGRHHHRRRQFALHRHRTPGTPISSDKGMRFIGAGVSGGEEGALKGPSHHARRSAQSSWEVMKPDLRSIAAKVGRRALRHSTSAPAAPAIT